jgi:hypothetical protein
MWKHYEASESAQSTAESERMGEIPDFIVQSVWAPYSAVSRSLGSRMLSIVWTWQNYEECILSHSYLPNHQERRFRMTRQVHTTMCSTLLFACTVTKDS